MASQTTDITNFADIFNITSQWKHSNHYEAQITYDATTQKFESYLMSVA